jgi:spore germination cell wall hydrolase CwlJ-like protein
MKLVNIIIVILILVGTAYGGPQPDYSQSAPQSASQSTTQSTTQLSQNDLYWLAKNIYYEARGESTIGQIMVGIVTISRLRSGKWGNTIKDVVTAPKQFSWYDPAKKTIPRNKKAWLKAKKLAFWSCVTYCMIGEPKIYYYHNLSTHPEWAKQLQKVFVVENHIFYEKKS